MGTVCPQGHDSASSDFCDVCGMRISSSLSRPDGMLGKHHAASRFVANGGDSCPRCGMAVTGQFCEACGFRVSARRPFAPLGDQAELSSPAPAKAWETAPSGSASSGPPESLFPPISKPEAPFSAWSKPQRFPSGPSPSGPSPSSQLPSSQPPPTAPGGQSARPSVQQAADVPGAPERPEEPGVAGPLESLFSPASRTSRPRSSPPPVASPPPAAPPPASPPPASPPSSPMPAPPVWSDPAPAPVSRPEPPTGPQVRAKPAPAPTPRREPSVPQSWSEPPAPPARPEPPRPVASRPNLSAPAVRPVASAPPTTPIPSLTSVTWTVLVAVDRVYYDRMRASGGMPSSAVKFPVRTSERRIRLARKH